ncbi:HNH endonuclease signature motif containing protein [Enterococcus sp. S86.2]|uniref:HNH endonuclease signature motif containing protein n=1 Tax=Enterococcus sp. S86.2 TaxID=3031299 RepID=UPI0026EF53F5|nr:HNH endonuclease signature motif containing protein [Enterococcus sp. S86.2]
MKPKKQCNQAGCKVLVDFDTPYCDKHKRKQTAAYDQYQNRKATGGKYFAFYHSKQWEKLSKLHKYREPICVECYKEGIIKKVDVADHVIPIRTKAGWDRRLDDNNLQSLCHFHHNIKSRKEKMERQTQGR